MSSILLNRRLVGNMTSHEITLCYDEELLRRAVFRYWWRQIGIGYVLALVVVAVYLVMLIAYGDTSWLVGAAGTVLGMGLLVMIAALCRDLSPNAAAGMMGDPHATLALSESSFTMSSGAGSSTVPWPTITESGSIDFWLLFFAKNHFFTVPLADFTPGQRCLFLGAPRIR